ncbi:hypothetical protein HDU77_010427 [Chytriomyces hyalinus]|nr:hypothetical protein HDU77_010427 [Chytriomyces hyalinus]
MHPVIPLILFGVQSETSPLSIFKRDNDALRLIIALVQESWISHIHRTDTPTKLHYTYDYTPASYNVPIPAGMFILPDCMNFPAPLKDKHGQPIPVHVNMMPFTMVDPDDTYNPRNTKHIAKTLPPNLKRYAALVAKCLRRVPGEHGKVGYISVHESYIEKGATQRRPGLHIESPGRSPSGIIPMHGYHKNFSWGGGAADLDEFGEINMRGGIFFGSNMAGTSRVWDCLIEDHDKVAGHLGDIGHLRKLIGGNEAGTLLDAGEIVWMTDRTPHESVPQPKSGFRQFFRIVTSEVSGWYEEHNTPSELGVAPNCDIVKGNKFLSGVKDLSLG